MQNPNTQRWEVHYLGRVQGVGFRHTASQIARRHPVKGFVRNLPNGQVHLVVEGDTGSLEAFLDEISEDHVGKYHRPAC